MPVPDNETITGIFPGKVIIVEAGKLYEWDAELLYDLISCPLDIHNHNQLSLIYSLKNKTGPP